MVEAVKNDGGGEDQNPFSVDEKSPADGDNQHEAKRDRQGKDVMRFREEADQNADHTPDGEQRPREHLAHRSHGLFAVVGQAQELVHDLRVDEHAGRAVSLLVRNEFGDAGFSGRRRLFRADRGGE